MKRAASSKIAFSAHFFHHKIICFFNKETKLPKKEKKTHNFQLGLYTGLDVSDLKGHSCSVFGLLEPLFGEETATEVHMPKKKTKEQRRKQFWEGKNGSNHKTFLG